jgi:enamine deaminase RidA (YjgF/YER057c/UK114 family)
VSAVDTGPTRVPVPGLHDPVAFGYSHVVVAPPGRLVVVGGQYGSGPDGHVTSPDFADQVTRSFDNLATALAAAGLTLDDVIGLRTFVVDHDPSKLEVLLAELHRRWGDRPPAQTLLGVAALALPDMLFEVDATAVAPPTGGGSTVDGGRSAGEDG